MKIALITYEFYPHKGGISHTYNSMCKSLKNTEHKLYVFNQHYKNKRIYNVLDNIDKHYTLKDLIIFFKKRESILFFLKSIWKTITDKEIKFNHKLMLILYFFVKPSVLIRTMKNVKSISQILKNKKLDIIFAGSASSYELPTVYLLTRIFNKKFIALAHGNEFLVSTRMSLKYYYLKRLDTIVVHTDAIKNIIKKINHVNEDKFKILPSGIFIDDYKINKSKEELRSEFNIPNNQFILISVGRQVQRKNFQLVIKALHQIIEQNSNIKIKYYLIGQGPETQNLKLLTKNLNLDEYVKFIGECDDITRNLYLKLSDVFIMLTLTLKNSIEGFGIVYIEANYYKVPVIGSTSGGIVEIINNGENGFLIDPNNADSLIEKILFLYENEDKRKMMGEIGHKIVNEKFSWDKLNKKYIEFFKNNR